MFKGVGVIKDSMPLKEDANPFNSLFPGKCPFRYIKRPKTSWIEYWKQTSYSDLTNQLIGGHIWYSPMVVTPKSNCKVKVSIDLSKLNKYIKRENRSPPAVNITLGWLAGSTVFVTWFYWANLILEAGKHGGRPHFQALCKFMCFFSVFTWLLKVLGLHTRGGTPC